VKEVEWIWREGQAPQVGLDWTADKRWIWRGRCGVEEVGLIWRGRQAPQIERSRGRDQTQRRVEGQMSPRSGCIRTYG
jgi:hypothetical protein